MFYIREWPTRLNDLSASLFLSPSFCTDNTKTGRQKERGRKMNTDELLANSKKQKLHSPLVPGSSK